MFGSGKEEEISVLYSRLKKSEKIIAILKEEVEEAKHHCGSLASLDRITKKLKKVEEYDNRRI